MTLVGEEIMNINICIGTREIRGRGSGDIGAISWF